ncbi:MAG: NF038122 family metalloprotease [Blastocatellia bacterium]
MVSGRAVCVEAGVEQARCIKDRDANLLLTVLTPDSDPSSTQRTGLKIILRGTSQLQSSPAAIEAFKRAAARWETQIRTPMTIVIDVDFGATLFGRQFEGDVVSATDAQVLGGNSLYPAVRADLIAGPYSPEETSLFGSLPPGAVPTDAGESTGLLASSATLRALDLIDPIAHPEDELRDFGPPPAVGLNSAFKFDFDAGDGIDPDSLDFEATALHELGHVLGFISFVGQREMDAAIELEPAIWDLFRLRPDAIDSAFSTSERILSSGGEQSFYAGSARLALSTGGPDGATGDGRQASHFQDDNLTGQYLGVMDPTIAPGEHQFLTDNDLTVLEAIGYRARSLTDPTAVVPLKSGLPQSGGIFAPPPNLGVLSHTHYSIVVPPGAAQLKIDLSGTQDIDLFARFGRTVFNSGHPVADYGSTTDSGSETITVTPSSSLPLRQGIYYFAVANFGPGDADFTISATVTGGNASRAPAIFDIRAHLEGDLLILDCAGADRDGDVVMAEVSLLDEAELLVSPSSSFGIDPGESTRVESRLAISGLSDLPTMRLARVVFVDREGNRSAAALVDLGKGEPGGLTLTSASFTESKLTLKVSGLAASLELEINGQVIAPPRKIKVKGSGKKLVINGNSNQLALQRGANRIRVKNANGWSNILILGF